MKIFIDTGGFAALYNKNDNYHEKAKNIWNYISQERALLFTSNFVVAETITLLRKRCGYQASVNFGDAVFPSSIIKILSINLLHENKAWAVYKKFVDQDFSFTDCTSFILMREEGIPQVFSFDRHFAILGFELIDVAL